MATGQLRVYQFQLVLTPLPGHGIDSTPFQDLVSQSNYQGIITEDLLSLYHLQTDLSLLLINKQP